MLSEHKKYGNNKAQRQFKADQQLRSEAETKIRRKKSEVSRDKIYSEMRGLLGKPKLGSLNDLI